MHRRREWLLRGGQLAALALAPVFGHAQAEEAPDALIKRLSDDVLGAVKADATLKTGDISRLMALVDTKVMPSVNFQRMTAGAVGPAWRQATPEQRTRLQEEFKTLLVRTYAGDTEVVVRTEVRGRGEPIQLDYRLEKTPGQGAGWKIYNLNVLGVWLMETYRSQFAQEINARGIDGLITTLAERNRSGNAAARKG